MYNVHCRHSCIPTAVLMLLSDACSARASTPGAKKGTNKKSASVLTWQKGYHTGKEIVQKHLTPNMLNKLYNESSLQQKSAAYFMASLS